MWSSWALWRLVKFVAMVAASAGLIGAATAPTRDARLRTLYAFGVPGFVGTWLTGWMLARIGDRSLAEPWILAGLIGSGIALHGAFLGAFARPARQRTLAPVLVWAGLFATVGWMVFRPTEGLALAGFGGLGALAGAALGAPWVHLQVGCEDSDLVQVRRGFRWVAWAEGTSAVLLMLVGLPLRAATGIHLDGGTGLLGWTHGVLFLVFLQTLFSTSRTLGWSAGTIGLGVVAALIPGGTFAFEHKLGSDQPGGSASSVSV